MFEVIVIEKDTLQVVDDYVDGSVGSIPNLTVIGATGCGDADMNMGLFKTRNTNFCLLGDDADGNEYEINQWSSMYGDPDEEGNSTYFYDEFPLLHFTGEEVWLTPHYSHNWSAEDLIVITIQ